MDEVSWLGISRALALGISNTLLVTLNCSIAALLFGGLVAFTHRVVRNGFATHTLDFVTYCLRAVPIAPFLFLIYFGAPRLGLFLPPQWAMVLSLGGITGAYLSEVFRSALESVDALELESALSSGLSRSQAFFYVEMPQAISYAGPGIRNELTSVLKYSPFAYTIGIPEMTKFAMTLNAVTLKGTQIYIVTGILYFAIYQITLMVVRYFCEGRSNGWMRVRTC